MESPGEAFSHGSTRFVALAGAGEGELGDLRDTSRAMQSRALTYGN